MNYTENLKLKKPEQEEFYDVDDFNHNADILDEQITAIKNDYALKGHNHDTTYSKLDHNHNNTYSKLDHNHDSDYVKKTGDSISGNLSFDTNHNIHANSNNGQLVFMGGSEWDKGAGIALWGKDKNGAFTIHSVDENGSIKTLGGWSDGTLTWLGQNIVRSVNGVNADASGNVDIANDKYGVKVVYKSDFFDVKPSCTYSFNIEDVDFDSIDAELSIICKVKTTTDNIKVGTFIYMQYLNYNGASASIEQGITLTRLNNLCTVGIANTTNFNVIYNGSLISFPYVNVQLQLVVKQVGKVN